jgi:CRP-like cAMP-binding protein
VSENHNLGDLELFSHLSEHHLEQLAGSLTERHHPAGSTLVNCDDDSREIYFVLTGTLRVWSTTPIGDFDFTRLEEGDLFGEVNYIDRLGRMGQVQALTDVHLLVFDQSSLSALTDLDPGFERGLYWCFWKSLSAKLRAANFHLSRFFSPGVTAGSRTNVAHSSPVDSEPRVDMAARKSLFREQRLPSMEINFLSSLATEETFAPGSTIFCEGDGGDKMYVIAEGQVMISKTIEGAGEEALSFLKRGDYFGEMALIDKQPRSADAKAHPELGAVVLGLRHEVVEQILDIDRLSSIRLLKILTNMASERLRKINEKLLGWHLVSGGNHEVVHPEVTPVP